MLTFHCQLTTHSHRLSTVPLSPTAHSSEQLCYYSRLLAKFGNCSKSRSLRRSRFGTTVNIRHPPSGHPAIRPNWRRQIFAFELLISGGILATSNRRREVSVTQAKLLWLSLSLSLSLSLTVSITLLLDYNPVPLSVCLSRDLTRL